MNHDKLRFDPGQGNSPGHSPAHSHTPVSTPYRCAVSISYRKTPQRYGGDALLDAGSDRVTEAKTIAIQIMELERDGFLTDIELARLRTTQRSMLA